MGEVFTGTISGVTQFGIFVQLDDIYIEGLVHITELGADYFQFDEARHELRGERTGKRYQLTDRVTVQVSRVDLDARKIDLSMAAVKPVRPSVETSASGELGMERDRSSKQFAPAHAAKKKSAEKASKTPEKTASKRRAKQSPSVSDKGGRSKTKSGKKQR